MKITLRNYLVDDKLQELRNKKISIEDRALLDGRPMNDNERVEAEEIQKKIEYMDSNAERTYVAPFIQGELYKAFFEIQKLDMDNDDPENIVKIVDFICRVYGNQFTAEQFLKGVKMSELSKVMFDTISSVHKMMMEGVEESDTQ